MRTTLLIVALTVGTLTTLAFAEEAPLTSPPSRTVYLDGPADLARLRQANPAHYARAERILAAANQLCRPGPGQLREVAGARDLKCAEFLLKTSNPPKRQISFTLDDTRYVALVTITDDPPRLTRAR